MSDLDRTTGTESCQQTSPESRSTIPVCPEGGDGLNGLGMMILQYLEQNLAEFEDKVEAVRKIRGRVCVEVEKGIATTISFLGDRILIRNGTVEAPDLHLKSSYLLFSRILCGKANPYVEILRGNIRLLAFPKKPVQSLKILRFLKIPEELLLEPQPGRKIHLLRIAGIAAAVGGLGLLLYYLFRILGGP